MIRFFRHLRQQLLTEQKWSKYLLYAIGEILLVMIGILLALQVNNWNETRQDRKFEKKAFLNLQSEFLFNQELFNQRLLTLDNRLKGLEEYLYTLKDKKTSIDQKTQKRPNLMFASWKPESNVINSLFSTGRIESIRNDSLKALLTKWNECMEEYWVAEDRYISNANKVYEYERPRIPVNLITDIGSRKTTFLFHTGEELAQLRAEIIDDIEYQNAIVSCVNMLKISLSQSK